MGSIVGFSGGALAFSSASGGKVTAVNNVSTTPAVVIAANPNRQKLVFHNPGTIDIYVAPSLDLNAAAISITSTLGGSFLIFANGGTLTLDGGEIQGAWQAKSASSSSNPLTIMDSNV